jgi:hypothetical protein
VLLIAIVGLCFGWIRWFKFFFWWWSGAFGEGADDAKGEFKTFKAAKGAVLGNTGFDGEGKAALVG